MNETKDILEAEAARLDNLRKALQHAIDLGERRYRKFGARDLLVEQIEALDAQIGAIKSALYQLSPYRRPR